MSRMWVHYRKRFWFSQAFIVLLTAVMWLYGKHWMTAVVAFGLMQVSAVIGAWSAARLEKNLDTRGEEPPREGP